MQLTISSTALARAVGAVGKVVETRNTIPILSNVMLTAAGQGLSVMATDLDILATAGAEADVAAAGSICVDAKLLADIARKASGDVTLQLEKDRLIVKSGRSRFALQTLPSADFPDLGTSSYDATFDIDLAALFAPVAFAISTEEVRFYLQGVFLHTVDGNLVAVATDGHRLASNQISIDVTFEGIIVPRKLVGLLPKGSARVSVSQQKIRIEHKDIALVGKLIDGTFPDYRRVIPSANDKIVAFDRSALLKASDRVSTISSERGRAVKFSISPDSIHLSVRSDSGDATDEIAAEYSGDPVDIGFNAAYVRDMLSVLSAERVSFAVADSGSPALVREDGNDNWTGVCMPMRVA